MQKYNNRTVSFICCFRACDWGCNLKGTVLFLHFIEAESLRVYAGAGAGAGAGIALRSEETP